MADPPGVLAALLRELRLPPTLLSPLLAHANAVEHDGERLGLISEADRGTVALRHSADSLLFALVRAPMPGERWADVGSGAGFPGVVLATCYPETAFVLVEPQRRRAGFLELQRAGLGLDNVEVSLQRSSDLPGGFDVAVARALAEPALALEALWRLTGPRGAALVAVGPSPSVPPGATEIDVARPGVDSPGRFFMMSQPLGGA